MTILSTMLRFVSAAILLYLAAFCVFGFLASFEYAAINREHVIYGSVGVGSLTLAGRLLSRKVSFNRSVTYAVGLFALLFTLLWHWVLLALFDPAGFRCRWSQLT
jgi:hypothetical protein